jgi:IclR family transcriptional regulator, acetate operon repressor
MCSQIKSQGFAVDDGEFIEGIRCVASPIRAQDGIIIGSLGISAPSQRFSDDRRPEWSAQVSDIARQIQGTLSNSAQEA